MADFLLWPWRLNSIQVGREEEWHRWIRAAGPSNQSTEARVYTWHLRMLSKRRSRQWAGLGSTRHPTENLGDHLGELEDQTAKCEREGEKALCVHTASSGLRRGDTWRAKPTSDSLWDGPQGHCSWITAGSQTMVVVSVNEWTHFHSINYES